jgi:hypothetical protein
MVREPMVSYEMGVSAEAEVNWKDKSLGFSRVPWYPLKYAVYYGKPWKTTMNMVNHVLQLGLFP